MITKRNARSMPGENTFKNQGKFITFAEAKQHARHQWPAILAGLSIDPAFLKNQHGPCPNCGGKDRFRFDDRDGNGGYYCNGCGADDGFSLLEKVHGWTALEALQAVARWLDMVEYGPAVTTSRKPVAAPIGPSPATVERMQAKIKAIWQAAIPLEATRAEAGRVYLEYHGLGNLFPFPNDVHLHPALPYWFPGPDGKPVELGRYPALLALVRSIDGKVRGLHRTYLQQDGQGKARVLSPAGEPLPAKKLLALYLGATRGCAIRLYPVTEGRLAVCEGLETGLSIWQAFHWPVWSFLSASGLEYAVIPTEVRTVAIMADHDANNTGQDAARALARRLVAMAEPPIIRLRMPARTDSDWLDAMIEGACHG